LQLQMRTVLPLSFMVLLYSDARLRSKSLRDRAGGRS